MLIESYVVNFSEVKRFLTSLQIEDFVVVSENIFALTEKQEPDVDDLLSDSTPVNHPEALLLVNKDYARNLIFNGDSFEFFKKSHDIQNLDGVSLHLNRPGSTRHFQAVGIGVFRTLPEKRRQMCCGDAWGCRTSRCN